MLDSFAGTVKFSERLIIFLWTHVELGSVKVGKM